jgi:hypothetical protein
MTTNQTNLSNELLNKYGPMIGGSDLYLALGFKTYGTFRLAKERGEIPIEIFKIPKRRDWYALTADLAQWLITLTQNAGCHTTEMES